MPTLPPALADLLTRPRVPWSRLDDATVEAVAHEARAYGDEVLYRRAVRAMARRVTGCR